MTLPFTPDGDDGDTDAPRLFDVAGREVEAAVGLFTPRSEKADVRVRGERLDGEEDRVIVSADVGGVSIELSLTSGEARSFASDIAEAARAVEEDR